ncbi:MAG: M48 family metalloprotease [Candidatus Hydrogenedentes bacterium]|nr:M48 family metalloprotease [Candidatus Hydrogenedentota bacterium]
METYVTYANTVAAQWAASIWPAVWQSAILAAGLLCLARFLRHAPASLRYWLWMLVPLRLLVMPLVSIPLPVLPTPSTDLTIQSPQTSFPPLMQNDSAPQWEQPSVETTAPAQTATASESSRATRAPISASWLTYVMLAWCGGALFQAARMARGWWWMRRIVADGQVVVDGPIVDAALRAGAMIGLPELPRIVLTDARVSPFACGIRRAVVVLPNSLTQQVSEPGLMAVLAHEFAHLRRRDPLAGVILGVCDTVYFFHPLVHWVRRQILFERERACDDLVLATSNAKPSAYANALCSAAQLARNTRPLTSPPILVAESFGDLKGRLTALTASVRPKATLSKASLIFLVALGALSVPGVALTTAEPVEGAFHMAPDLSAVQEASGPAEHSAALMTLAANETGATQESAPTRIIHFPNSRALGVVSVRRIPPLRPYRLGPDYSAVVKWDFVAAARGDVAVPVGKDVKLTINGQAVLQDLSPLQTLSPNDLDALEIYCPETIQANADRGVMPHLAGLTGLKSLDLSLPDLTDRGMRYLKGLTALEDVHLRAPGVTEAGFTYLEGMQSLQALWSWTDLTDQGLAHVGRLSSLRELSINVTKIQGPGLTQLAQLPRLEHLELQGANFGNNGLKYLSDLPALKSLWLRGDDQPLKSLRLLALGKSVTTDKALVTLSEMDSLEELWLSSNPKSVISDAGLSQLTKLRHLKRLHTGGTSNTPITDEGLRSVSTMSSLRELQVCGGEGITDAGIAHLATLTQLEKLFVMTDSHRVTDQSLVQIGALKNLQNLYIFCSKSPFTTSGLNALNGLTRLEFLSISGAKHDDAVLDWSGLTRLEDLTITMTPFRDADLVSLGKLTNLKRLQGITGTLASLTGWEVAWNLSRGFADSRYSRSPRRPRWMIRRRRGCEASCPI